MHDPHGQAQVVQVGAPLDSANVVVVLLHGRGGSVNDTNRMSYQLMSRMANPDTVAFLLPQATGNVWYPQSGFLPQDQQQPWLDSALGMLDQVVDASPAGIPVVLGGFSQGAMLSLEYASRGRRALAGVIAFSGALIGPLDPPHERPAGVEGLPVFIGCGTNDDWIGVPFIEETARLLADAGAIVDKRLYDGMGHRINDDEFDAAASLIDGIAGE